MPNRTCSIDGCDRQLLAKGLCHSHYYKAKYVPVIITKTCPQCGIEYTRSGQGGPTYCSRACCKKAYSEPEPTSCRICYGVCKQCAKTFVSKRKPAAFCSAQCRRDHQIGEYRRQRTCPDCKAPIVLNQQRCEPCSDKQATDTRRAGNLTRRARETGARVETVRPMDVYKRDRWQCGICNKQVRQSLQYPHPMSASLDHVIPLSWGGEHSMVNTQLAHWICNVKKGARQEVQPALFA